MNALRIIGTEKSNGERCHCCGTPCPTKRIVLEDHDGNLYRYGSTCAAQAAVGQRSTLGARKLKQMDNQIPLFL